MATGEFRPVVATGYVPDARRTVPVDRQARGIDVSHHFATFPWQLIQEKKYSFIISKATGPSGSTQILKELGDNCSTQTASMVLKKI